MRGDLAICLYICLNLKRMKILSTEQIKLADQFTIENEPIASIDL